METAAEPAVEASARKLQRPRRPFLNDAGGLHQGAASQVVGQLPGEELLEDDAEGVDVASGIDLTRSAVKLLRAHVLPGA